MNFLKRFLAVCHQWGRFMDLVNETEVMIEMLAERFSLTAKSKE
jgi:hypothetical protein